MARNGADAPNLDRLSVLDEAGGRKYVYPADARGKFSRIKPFVYAVLIAVYVGLPWIPIGGHPAVLIDLPMRRFYLFGATFNAQDVYLIFFLLTGIGFGLIMLSALWGRVWCGWGCPQTVFLDGVFRRLERWIEGPASRRKRLADGPWTLEKIWKKGLKHAIYVVLSAGIGLTFVAYFVGVDGVGEMFTAGPGSHPAAFAWSLGLTVVMYGNFWWFREQLCIVICPYGRLQSVLNDQDTINVTYDYVRGEPRGKVKDPERGDCIDCGRCVAVCPTGIDIRNGHQLECIGCAYCIDACDEIMDRVDQPRGLIRYESDRGVEERRRRFWRPRVFAYMFAGLAGLSVGTFMVTQNDPFEANLMRVQGAPYVVDDGELRNQLFLHLTNKGSEETTYTIRPLEGQEDRWVLPQRKVTVPSLTDSKLPVVAVVPHDAFEPGMTLGLTVHGTATDLTRTVEMRILGPKARAASAEEHEDDGHEEDEGREEEHEE
ncbi:MAG: cytochrome c oxidase accessory protein CcoG [Myxococcota bacterium]